METQLFSLIFTPQCSDVVSISRIQMQKCWCGSCIFTHCLDKISSTASHKYGPQAEWSRKAVFAVWRKRKLYLLSPISCGQVISTFPFPPEQQHLHEILTGTKFTSNVTSLIVNRGQQVPGCKRGRWPGCSWISNGVNVKSNLYLSVIVYTVR